MKRTLYCFIGESGSGKNAIVTAISNRYGIQEVIGYTARLPRYPGEGGYIFSDEETYQKHKAEGLVFEETEIENKDSEGNIKKLHYWILESQFDFEGKKMLVCDKEGVRHVQENLKDTEIVIIHIKTDMMTRFRRLVQSSRKQDEEEKFKEAKDRIDRSKEKFKVIPCNWVVDNNGDLEETIGYVKTIMEL
jgi:guanylate kinase